MLEGFKSYWRQRQLPQRAKQAMRIDHEGLQAADPGPEAVITASMNWLGRAQDLSRTPDGGVSRDFSLIQGWNTSYPETTGYIIPTFLQVARLRGDDNLAVRARRMLDWFREIQFPEGGFQGGRIDSTPRVPVTFNTGQILIGMAAGTQVYGETYADATRRAARWLRDSLDPDGCWRKHPTPFAAFGEKTYETHVSWGLFEADRVCPGEGFGAAGLRQVDWALTKQKANGWFADCCLDDPIHPLTHTIGYALRGILEAYRFANDAKYLDAAQRTAQVLIGCQRADGALPGRLDANWKPAVDWSCLTGNAQVASCWFLLARHTGDRRYHEAGARCLSFVRRTVALEGDPDVLGGVKGAFPIEGDYGAFQFLNWSAKFTVDACLHELGHFEEV